MIVPVYPWPRHPEYYRRIAIVDNRARWLRDAYGHATNPMSGDDEVSSGNLATGIEQEPLTQFADTGAFIATPNQAAQLPLINAHDGSVTVPTVYVARYFSFSDVPPIGPTYDDRRYVKIVPTGSSSGLSDGAPYWLWRAITVPVTPDPSLPGAQALFDAIPIYFAAFFDAAQGSVSRRTRFEGQHIRLAYDGTVSIDGQMQAEFDLLNPTMSDTLRSIDMYWVGTYPAQVRAWLDSREQFAGRPVVTHDSVEDFPDRNDYSVGMQRSSQSLNWPVTDGRWIDASSTNGVLTGEDSYRFYRTPVFSGDHSGRVLIERNFDVLLESGELWRHSNTTGAREVLIDTDVVYFEAGSLRKYFKSNGQEFDLP